MEEWLLRPAWLGAGARAPSPSCSCSLASLPTLRPAKPTRPQGFPGTWRRPLRFPSFLPPTLIEKAEGEAGPQQREGGEPGEAPAAASARLLPQPLTPASARACAALPTRPGRRSAGVRTEESKAGGESAWASGRLVASGRAGRRAFPAAFRRPSPAQGTRSPPPTRDQPPPPAAASPAVWCPDPHAATEGGLRAETHR